MVLEVALNADRYGDLILGSATTTSENKGIATLLRQSDGLAAVQVGGQNQILWRHNPGNFLHIWMLDASWSWQSSSGYFDPFSAAALGVESNFQLDLNGNGVIG
jgi:hypothetical protein